MIDKNQLRNVVKDVLKALSMHSPSAEDLIMGTIAQESRMGTYLKQLGKGPALGICQMEPATHKDIWVNYISNDRSLASHLWTMTFDSGMFAPDHNYPNEQQLIGNLYYAIAMCRIHYRRIKAPLPQAGDIAGYAAYWKKYYNTSLGKGTEAEFIANYNKYVA